MFKQKLMGNLHKKGAKELDPLEKKAKMDVVKSLSDQAGSMMGDKMKGMGKVTVASDSPEGLHKGLEKADALLQHPAGKGGLADHTGSPAKGGESDGDVSPEEGSDLEESLESPEEEAAEGPAGESEEELALEHADHSPEELDAKIQKLIDLKAKKEAGHA